MKKTCTNTAVCAADKFVYSWLVERELLTLSFKNLSYVILIRHIKEFFLTFPISFIFARVYKPETK